MLTTIRNIKLSREQLGREDLHANVLPIRVSRDDPYYLLELDLDPEEIKALNKFVSLIDKRSDLKQLMKSEGYELSFTYEGPKGWKAPSRGVYFNVHKDTLLFTTNAALVSFLNDNALLTPEMIPRGITIDHAASSLRYLAISSTLCKTSNRFLLQQVASTFINLEILWIRLPGVDSLEKTCLPALRYRRACRITWIQAFQDNENGGKTPILCFLSDKEFSEMEILSPRKPKIDRINRDVPHRIASYEADWWREIEHPAQVFEEGTQAEWDKAGAVVDRSEADGSDLHWKEIMDDVDEDDPELKLVKKDKDKRAGKSSWVDSYRSSQVTTNRALNRKELGESSPSPVHNAVRGTQKLSPRGTSASEIPQQLPMRRPERLKIPVPWATKPPSPALAPEPKPESSRPPKDGTLDNRSPSPTQPHNKCFRDRPHLLRPPLSYRLSEDRAKERKAVQRGMGLAPEISW